MLTYEHGSRDGVGSRLVVDIDSGSADGNFRMVFAIYRQTNDGGTARDGLKKWEFDDATPAIVELSATQVSHIIKVLRGESDSIFGDSGLVVKDKEKSSRVIFEKVDMPYLGYKLNIKTAWVNGETVKARILLNPTEALALRLAIESSMGMLAFGNS